MRKISIKKQIEQVKKANSNITKTNKQKSQTISSKKPLLTNNNPNHTNKMSTPQQQPQSFSSINVNAIKNTKLFQKFMQNKSGLLVGNSSSSASSLVNRTVEVKSRKEDREQEERGEGSGGQRKMVIDLMKKDSNSGNLKRQLQNDMNTQNSHPQQHYYQSSKPHQQPQPHYSQQPQPKLTLTRSPLPHQQHYQHSQLQTYQNQRLRQQDLEYYQSQKPILKNLKQQVMGVQQQFGEQQSQKSHGQKRKRNFNGYVNNGGGQKSNINNEAMRSSSSRQQSFNADSFTEEMRQHLPIKTTNHIQQKYAKLQSSPNRSNTTYPHSYNIAQYKNPQKSYNQQYNQPIPPPTFTSPQYLQSEYKQKYQQLVKKYQQLKHELKTQSKHRKKQFTECQHQIQMLKQKLFDVQSRQDSLLIQNQRLKDKFQSENLTKMKTQQENKQLTFRIKQLQDQLSMKQSSIKQKADETSYWKAQVDTMKQQLNIVKLGLEKKIDEYNLLFGDYQIVKKERDNKDYLLDDLRKNINGLVEENSLAKDEIFKLVTKLYQMEQQNQILRNDLKRQQLDTSQIHNYMKDLKEQSHQISRERVQSSYIERDRQPQHNIYEPHVNPMERSGGKQQQLMGERKDMFGGRSSLAEQEKPMNDKPTRRRGEFARERGQVVKNQKLQKDDRPLPVRQNPQHQKSISDDRPIGNNHHNNNYTQVNNKPNNFTVSNNNNNKFARMQQISQELEKIKDMKAMNGAIRRKKIDLQRQLQELQQKMN